MALTVISAFLLVLLAAFGQASPAVTTEPSLYESSADGIVPDDSHELDNTPIARNHDDSHVPEKFEEEYASSADGIVPDNSNQREKRSVSSADGISPDISHELEKRSAFNSSCQQKLYIMAFTSGVQHAGSYDTHGIELQAGQDVRQLELHHSAEEFHMTPNKGDLWEISFSDFNFSMTCITIEDITKISIVARGTDGWNIGSIVTFVRDAYDQVQLLTQDLNANRWIDGNSLDSYAYFKLTLA